MYNKDELELSNVASKAFADSLLEAIGTNTSAMLTIDFAGRQLHVMSGDLCLFKLRFDNHKLLWISNTIRTSVLDNQI